MLRRPSIALLITLLAAPASAQSLSEAEVIRRAVESSPTLRAAMADARASRAGVDAAERATVPSFYLTAEGGYAESLGGTAQGVTFNPAATASTMAGVRATTAWGTTIDFGVGGTVSYRETNRDPSTTLRVALGPYYGLESALTIRQPLLRGNESYDASVQGARASEIAAERERDAAASELLRGASSAYWELWYADRALALQREALAVAERQRDEAQLRATDLGDLAPSEVLRFASEVASIEEAVAEAEASRRVAAIELGRLLSIAPDALDGLAVDPSAPVVREAPDADTIGALVRTRSSELLALAQGVEAAQQRVRAAADAAEPQLDVWARFGAASLYSADMADPFARPAFTAMAGVDLELPVAGGVAQAQHDQAVAQLEATELRYEARLRAIEAEAATAAARLDTAARRTVLARRTADLAQELATAEARRLELGASTPLELLAAQQSARASELRYLRALVDHSTASLAVDHLTGALTERFATLSSTGA